MPKDTMALIDNKELGHLQCDFIVIVSFDFPGAQTVKRLSTMRETQV